MDMFQFMKQVPEKMPRKVHAIKVLMVNLEGQIAGSEKSLLLLAKYIPIGVRISVACPSPSPLSDELGKLKVKTFGISWPPRRLNWHIVWMLYFVLVNLELILIFLKTRPFLIHANNSKSMLASTLIVFLTRIKLIWHVRDMANHPLVLRVGSHLSYRIVAVSNAVKETLVHNGIKESAIDVVYNAIEVKNHDLHRKMRQTKGPLIFANVGQFVPWKKQDVFLNAADNLLKEGEDVEFILIGDDILKRDMKYKAKVLAMIQGSPFANKIKLIGWHQDIEPWWCKVDCLVHPAVSEPFGRVIIEAMSYGVPVIAADSGGPSEIIQDGITGLLFEPNNVADLTCLMGTIIENPGLSQKISTAGHRYAVSHFQAEKIAKRIEEIYKEVLAA
jgi:glycosyltransferase involved in cell wall biosynthesis